MLDYGFDQVLTTIKVGTKTERQIVAMLYHRARVAKFAWLNSYDETSLGAATELFNAAKAAKELLK